VMRSNIREGRKSIRMSGTEWRYVRKLPFETNNKKCNLGRVKSKKISKHPGGNLLQSSMEVCDT